MSKGPSTSIGSGAYPAYGQPGFFTHSHRHCLVVAEHAEVQGGQSVRLDHQPLGQQYPR